MVMGMGTGLVEEVREVVVREVEAVVWVAWLRGERTR